MISQVLRFAGVGVLSTGIHALIYALTAAVGLVPWAANLAAFCVAFGFSFLGHYRFTFQSDSAVPDAISKFFWVALMGLGLNAGFVYLIVDWAQLHYLVALAPMIFVVPPVTFLLSRYWAFKSRTLP